MSMSTVPAVSTPVGVVTTILWAPYMHYVPAITQTMLKPGLDVNSPFIYLFAYHYGEIYSEQYCSMGI